MTRNYKTLFFLIFFIGSSLFSFSQNFNAWSAGTFGPYTDGIMTATITRNACNMNNSTPKYTAGQAGPPCYIAGLALDVFFQNVTNAWVRVDMDFTQSGTTNGTCNSFSFNIRDINSDESMTTFLDVVEISAIDGNNVAVPLANIVAAGGSFKFFTSSGNTRIIKGHNNNSETPAGSYNSNSCDDVGITVTPPAGVPLKSIRILYRPGYGAGANSYYNWTVPAYRPANQYISITNLTGNPTGGGCTTLPVELLSFTGKRMSDANLLNWITASETNNEHFEVERSADGESFISLGSISGAGNSNSLKEYSFTDDQPLTVAYYRLKQVDFDGGISYSQMIAIGLEANSEVSNISIYPNPSSTDFTVGFLAENQGAVSYKLTDISGRILIKGDWVCNSGQNVFTLNTDMIGKGVFYLELEAGATKTISKVLKY